MILFVSFKGTVHDISLDSSSTLADLKREVASKTAVAPHHQKLMHKLLSGINKGILSDDRIIESIGLKDGDKIILIGSTDSDIAAVEDRNRRLQERQPLKPAKPFLSASDRLKVTSQYTFGSIKILTAQKYREQARAISLMKELSEDLGVREIMRVNMWQIGELIEICPQEQPSILGYNRNKGQTIALRLRTDDLSGFRTYNVIRKTLLHELTHMVHSEHDHQFWALNRVLNEEVTSRNWTKVGGNSVSKDRFFSLDEGNPKSEFTGGVHVLGGRDILPLSSSRRDLLAKAAEIRITKEEEDEAHTCGSKH
eukprot:Partr_v1_DN28728_c0_g1_i2_m63307 putative Ubiquitin metalloprotease fusion protein